MSQSILNNDWLTDDPIKVYYDLLRTQVVGSTDIFLMDPVISQGVKCLEDIDYLIEDLNLTQKTSIIIPVNNSPAIDIPGGSGSHWSLLLYIKDQHKYVHFDSAGSANFEHALLIACKLNTHMGIKNDVNISAIPVPKQSNGQDCGVYMVMFTEIVLQLISEKIHCKEWEKCFPYVTEWEIANKRFQLAMLYSNNTQVKIKASTIKTMMLKPTFNLTNHNKHTHKENREPKQTFSTNNVTTDSSENRVNLTNQYSCIDTDAINNCEKAKNDSLSDDTSTQQHSRLLAKQIGKQHRQGHAHTEQRKQIGNKNSKLHVTFCSDSQGRNVQAKIENFSGNKVGAFGYVRANAGLLQVLESCTIDQTKTVIIMGGTNDSLDDNLHNIYKDLEQKLTAISKSRTVFITTIPKRFDKPSDHEDNKKLTLLSNYIGELVARIDNTKLLNLDQLKRYHFTEQGLHLNNKGKNHLVNLIINTLSKEYNLNLSPGNLIGKIKITEAHMGKYIIKSVTDKKTALAHCISADINQERNMSAGVAVIFKNHFGRPKPSDFLNKHLTCKTVNNGPTVYGLVTKDKYYKKPSMQDYNLAFNSLIQDFKNKPLEQLICSPMGCTRDKISIDIFSKNLVRFQQMTGANVNVVVYNEKQKNSLWNKKSFPEFVNELRSSIASYDIQTCSSDALSPSSNQDFPLSNPEEVDDTSLRAAPVSEGNSLMSVPDSPTTHPSQQPQVQYSEESVTERSKNSRY
ncbi:hypothetical protein J6590_090586 [Homalodisca vitripennis]|nr:hypothetical protein J6590_090586 [Homalodisca vitripennis]